VSRKVGGTTVPHFRVVLGGEWEHNAGAYGLTIGAIPSKRVPDFVERITAKYLQERTAGEAFRKYIERVGKQEIKTLVDELSVVPPYERDRSYYSDWRDPAVRLGWAVRPEGVAWRHLFGAGLIGGVGFTVALFITGLAFTDKLLIEEAKVGVLSASLIAALAGYVFLRLMSDGQKKSQPNGNES